MRVTDIMTATFGSIRSSDSIADAARRMGETDVGALPILSDGRLVGMVTDRDIVVRGVAAGIPVEPGRTAWITIHQLILAPLGETRAGHAA